MAFDFSSIPSALKILYSPEAIANEAYQNRPLLGLIPKRTDLVGKQFTNFIIYGNAQSGSATFATAQNNATSAANINFNVPPVQDYTPARVDNMTIMASKNDKGAFLEALKMAVDTAMNGTAQSLATSLVGDGTGILGYVGTTTSTAITLTDAQQVVNFDTQMYIQTAFLSGGVWTLRNSGAQSLLTNIDRNLGILTATGGLPSGTVAGDAVVRSGDMPNGLAANNLSGTTGGLKFAGLAGFLPLNRPVAGGGDNFGGQDRSKDSTRLAGCYFDGRQKTPEEGITGLAALIDREGGKPDIYVVNQLNWNNLRNSLGSKVIYETVEAFENPQIGFNAMKIDAPSGPIRVVADRTLASNVGYMLQLNTWTLWSMGMAPGILNYPMYGQAAVPISNADGIELRIGYYGLLSNRAPAWNGVNQLL